MGSPRVDNTRTPFFSSSPSPRLDLDPSKRQPTDPPSPDANENPIGKVIFAGSWAHRRSATGTTGTLILEPVLGRRGQHPRPAPDAPESPWGDTGAGGRQIPRPVSCVVLEAHGIVVFVPVVGSTGTKVQVLGDVTPGMPIYLRVGVPIIWGWFAVRLPIIWGWKCRTSRDGSRSGYRTSGDGLPFNGGWFRVVSSHPIQVAPSLTIRTFV